MIFLFHYSFYIWNSSLKKSRLSPLCMYVCIQILIYILWTPDINFMYGFQSTTIIYFLGFLIIEIVLIISSPKGTN